VTSHNMDVARILVVQESTETTRDLRLVTSRHPVEFSFCTFDQVVRGEADLSSCVAIVATLDCDHGALVESLRKGPDEGPPLFLFRSDPPLQEIARWITLARTQEGPDLAVTMRLLSESTEYYSLASLYQQCLKIMTCKEEEKLLTHIADTFANELGAESCVVWLASPLDPDEMKIASVKGLISIDREGSRFFLSQTDWADATVKGNPFLHPFPEHEGVGMSRDPGGANLYIPLLYREKPIGLVKLVARTDRKPFGERDIYVASIIAGYAASARENATRLANMGKVSIRDKETQAYSPGFLSDYFEKESYKSGRFRRPLSVVFMIVDNVSSLVEQTRESLVAAAIADMVDAVRKALRDSDLIARMESNRFCVVLPETDHFGSVLAARRLRKAVREHCRIPYMGRGHLLEPFFVPATMPRDGKDLMGLWRVAEEKYFLQKRSPFHRMHLQEKILWSAFDILLGKPEYYGLLREGQGVPYFSRFTRDLGRNGHFCLDRETFLQMVESVAQDAVSRATKRGLVIAAGPRPEMFKQIFLSLGSEAGNGRKVYIIGRAGSTRFDSKNLLYVNAEDDHLRDREIVLCLKENGAYGLFATHLQDEMCGFNTSDEWLVDSMLEKVQETYHLQGNF
jgi:two-component system cell cycle response regulator